MMNIVVFIDSTLSYFQGVFISGPGKVEIQTVNWIYANPKSGANTAKFDNLVLISRIHVIIIATIKDTYNRQHSVRYPDFVFWIHFRLRGETIDTVRLR